jgi:hypothetical protein
MEESNRVCAPNTAFLQKEPKLKESEVVNDEALMKYLTFPAPLKTNPFPFAWPVASMNPTYETDGVLDSWGVGSSHHSVLQCPPNPQSAIVAAPRRTLSNRVAPCQTASHLVKLRQTPSHPFSLYPLALPPNSTSCPVSRPGPARAINVLRLANTVESGPYPLCTVGAHGENNETHYSGN